MFRIESSLSVRDDLATSTLSVTTTSPVTFTTLAHSNARVDFCSKRASVTQLYNFTILLNSWHILYTGILYIYSFYYTAVVRTLKYIYIRFAFIREWVTYTRTWLYATQQAFTGWFTSVIRNIFLPTSYLLSRTWRVVPKFWFKRRRQRLDGERATIEQPYSILYRERKNPTKHKPNLWK